MMSELSRKIEIFARQVNFNLSKLIAPTGIRPYAVKLKQDNIILKNLQTWKGQDIRDIREFSEAMNNSGIVSILKEREQKIFVTKDNDVTAQAVTDAIRNTVSILDVRSTLLPFPGNKTYWPEINISLSHQNEFPMCIFQKGSISFNPAYLSMAGPEGLNIIKEKGRELACGILKKQGLPVSDYIKTTLPHVNDVFTAYYQIGSVYYDQGFMFNPKEIRKQKGLLRLFDERVSENRIIHNINFLKELYVKVPNELIIPTINKHDIGKAISGEENHAVMGVKLLEKDDPIEGSTEQDHILRLILKNSVRHHLVPSGVSSLGEYSLLCLYDIFEEPEISEIIASGKVNLFIDNLTLLTACDVAGQKKFVPLNRKIEDLAIFNRHLKKIFSKIVKADDDTYSFYVDEEGKKYFYSELTKLAQRTSETRICHYLSGQDGNLDARTNDSYSFYLNKLKETFSRMNISSDDRNALVAFFAMLKSFPYSGMPLNYILWSDQGEADAGEKLEDVKINENAIRFLVYLSKTFFLYFSKDLEEQLKEDRMFNITAGLFKQSGKPIHNIKRHSAFIRNFKAMINDGVSCFPKVTFIAGEKNISLKIYLPEWYKPKEKKK
jgi:hypothetical protein